MDVMNRKFIAAMFFFGIALAHRILGQADGPDVVLHLWFQELVFSVCRIKAYWASMGPSVVPEVSGLVEDSACWEQGAYLERSACWGVSGCRGSLQTRSHCFQQ